MLQMHVSSVSDVIIGILQVFHTDVVKVDRDVLHVTSVLEACCKCFRDMLQVFV
jgi:hypothetical protein